MTIGLLIAAGDQRIQGERVAFGRGEAFLHEHAQAPAPLPDSPPSAKSPMASFEVTSSSNDETDRSKNNDLANRLDSLEANVTRLTQRLEALERRSDNPEA